MIPTTAFALSWDGSSAGGTGGTSSADANGYAIRTSSDNCIGYRFSAVTSSGSMKVSKVIDVYRDTYYGNLGYSDGYKFSTKNNKMQLISKQNNGFSTAKSTSNCYKESAQSFSTDLPAPSGMETWQNNENNINKILSLLGVGSVSNMSTGDMLLVEPIYDIRLESVYHSITVTETALYGKYILGASSNGGTSNTSASWGFISSYTNRVYPNALYTPDGKGLWTSATAIGSSSKETFYNIINKGYGVGIAYQETGSSSSSTTSSTYTIKFDGNGSTSGSTSSMTMTVGTSKSLNSNGFSKTGYEFTGWNTKANGSGTSYSNRATVKDLTTAGKTITLYAQWEPAVLEVYYNANGGALDSTKYKLLLKTIYTASPYSKFVDTWTYNNTKSNGLFNASTFGLYRTGYTFTKWGTSSYGGTLFDQDDTTIKPTDLKSSIKYGDTSLTLYAQWNPNTYTIKFDGNGSTSGSTASMSMTYDVSKNLTANGFSKSGYVFAGWNTKANGTGTSYVNKESVKNLTSVNGATVTLYAQWTVSTYSIAFNGNGHTGGSTASMSVNFDTPVTLRANGFTRTGYTFKNWNTKSNGSGTTYTDKQTVTNLSSTAGSTIYLYAQWNPNSYTIKFDGNGNTGGSTASMSMTYDVAKNLTANGFTKTGYLFNGWNTKSNGGGSNYTDKQQVKNLSSTNGDTVTLYAKWKPITYTIQFDGNGNTGGSTASMSMTYDVAKNLTANGFTKSEYKFTGWNTKADGTGTAYTDKQSVKNLKSTDGSTITLYAQWIYDPILDVKECDAYSGNKSDKTKLFGISTGETFDEYEYKTDYATIGDTVWFNVYFPAETQAIRVRQYVKNGGDWITRDVNLNSNNSSSLWFPVQFSDEYKTVTADIEAYEVQAKMDWIDGNGNVLKSGTVETFYIPIKPVVYRNEVKIRGYEGGYIAYNGTNGLYGMVYNGQHITISYRYSTDSTWGPSECLRGSLYYYNGSEWVTAYTENSGYDASANNRRINSTSTTTVSSALGTYTVPKSTQNKLRFKLETWWSKDKEHTHETTWIEIPIVPVDIELCEIQLIRKGTGIKLDPNDLVAGETVQVRYIYKNNTATRVYINGFRDDKTQIDGVWSLNANSRAYLAGYDFVVPNKRTFDLWGGIYLEGMGIYNTEYETDGTNNELTLHCKVRHPLTLTPIAQNADYRENTEVITSFWLNNTYTDDYTPSDNISILFKVYNGTKQIATYTKTQAIVPGLESNLVYFKWKVPTGLNGADVTITGEIIEDGASYNLASANYTTTPYTVSSTDDTQFEKTKPAGFSIPLSKDNKSYSASWWEWTYSSGEFKKVSYAIGIADNSATLTPATGSTAVKNGSSWTMKSGYGLSLALTNSNKSISGYTTPSSAAYTKPQYAFALMPEFDYSTKESEYRTLELVSNEWKFRTNGTYGRVHFTPLWYPDGKYIMSITQSDCWTPAGMITRTINTNTINISESAYDDWYVGR